MKVYLVHHVDALSAEQDPQRHISPKGRDQADRLGVRFRALGRAPCVLHTTAVDIDPAERIAARLGRMSIPEDRPTRSHLRSVAHSLRKSLRGRRHMMGGHVDSCCLGFELVCGDEPRRGRIQARTAPRLSRREGRTGHHYSWLQDHAPGDADFLRLAHCCCRPAHCVLQILLLTRLSRYVAVLVEYRGWSKTPFGRGCAEIDEPALRGRCSAGWSTLRAHGMIRAASARRHRFHAFGHTDTLPAL